jgi:phage gpG-like protein
MSVVVTRSGDPPRVPLDRIAKLVATLAPGLIRERTGKGLDVRDKGFVQYSKDYKDAKVAAGRNAGVNLTVTNGLLGSVAAVSVFVTEQGFTIVIAPGAGTSAAVQFVDGKATRTGKRSPTHSVLGAIHHYGRGRMPARPWLALSPKDLESLMRQLLAVGIAIPLRGRS